ncbi:PfkB family carbohydrate kinase [Demequina aurantiaca]|uniref:PfkB family carbohydrate kinase n=1 Tax=Demequina aurantiaca TaxID=676200 RepID=UPI000782A62F|nr:PfkB family carbohydrate kinase [Demequina aurantiaca]
MTVVPQILVVGGINQDEVARVTRHPLPGETVIASSLDTFQGGKGANQACAAATAHGAAVTVQMAGAVGDDAAGQSALAALGAAGVDTTMIARVPGVPTGRAYITVSDEGQNSIVVATGANAQVSTAKLESVSPPTLVVAQTEVGAEAINDLSGYAERVGARLVINNGPVVELSASAMAMADPLVVNEHEAAELLDQANPPLEHLALARSLLNRYGSRSVVVTLGSAGSVVADGEGARYHAAPQAPTVVDTTGAGDTFVGALAAALALGSSIDDAIVLAAEAATASVGWAGARLPLH